MAGNNLNNLQLSAEDNKDVKECGRKMNGSGMQSSQAVDPSTLFKPSPCPNARGAAAITTQAQPDELSK